MKVLRVQERQNFGKKHRQKLSTLGLVNLQNVHLCMTNNLQGTNNKDMPLHLAIPLIHSPHLDLFNKNILHNRLLMDMPLASR